MRGITSRLGVELASSTRARGDSAGARHEMPFNRIGGTPRN
jgi:hypothetical protein